MNHARIALTACLLVLHTTLLRAEDGDQTDAPSLQVAELLVIQKEMRSVAFRDIVQAVSGHTVRPLDPNDTACGEMVQAIEAAADAVLQALNDPKGEARRAARINEVSALAEAMLRKHLAAHPALDCEIPATNSGKRQRSGYPDLLIRHRATGRVAYLDPKLFARDQEASTFRTFYYQPRKETNKIQTAAHHLLLGFSHDGKTGAWTFTDWKMVDLHQLSVRLKIEFQASNRDLYGDGVAESERRPRSRVPAAEERRQTKGTP